MGILSETRVEAVMATPVETIASNATAREAAVVMRDHDINALLVPGVDAGIFTSTDLRDAIADGHDPDRCRVADVMTTPVESVTTDLRLGEAAAMMTTYGFNHLPVRDSDGDYVGIVSSTDIKERLAEPSDE
ncbi:cyclic nucleotide-binding/CBS domain-containing protein [Halomarina halobia]|uniref:Cyclic nucleotide-binding/CBS domain-containing protein n=1 Tax=Halomarina halobia TaxID=3033386 RepID=A0ABD6A619_9EURY|nr:CBS domain-containing protein [Halomarina sp. PSR21]